MRRATLLLATLLTVALPLSAQAAGGKTAALTTPWGQARTLHTPDGKQLVVSTKGGPGVATHHVVEHSGGQLYLSPVRSIHTPFGPSDVVVARGKLGHSILINGKRYAVADVDGAFVYRDSKGQRHTGAIRDGNNLVFPEGVAKQIETYEGTQHVLVTEQWDQPLYQKVSFENGTMSLVALEPIGTQYGQATLGMKGNVLEQRIELDGHSFKLSTNKQGLPVFTDGSGKSYTSFARSGRSILTGRGATTRGQYNGKAVDLLQTTDYYGAPSWQRVTQEDGQLQFEGIDVLQTPYGATTLGKHGTAFEQRLDVGKDGFLVLDKGNGKLAYVGADGVEQTGVIHHGASLLTPSGLTKTVQLHGKSVEILQSKDYYGTTTFQSVAVQDGELAYEAVAPLSTQYGATTVALRNGKLEQRLEVAGSMYSVEERGKKTFYVDGKGVEHDSIIRTATGIRTPTGLTKKLRMVDGDHEILAGTDYYGTRTYQKVTVAAGTLEYEQIAPLTTPFGSTTFEVSNTKLDQTIVIGNRKFLVGQTKSGAFVYTDKAGVEHKGAPRIGTSLLTPYGTTERMVVDGLEQDVVIHQGTSYGIVSLDKGDLAYDWLSGTLNTPHGVAHAVYGDKRIDHQIMLGGTTYTVVKRRNGTLGYVDAHGKPYRDDYAAKLRSTKPAPVTVRRVLDKSLAPLPEGPIVDIMNTQHMSQATYDQLRDAMVDAMTKYSPADHYFIGLGSDPHPIIAFLENVGGRGLATNFPASGKYPYGVPSNILDPYVRKLIPAEVLNGSKKLVLVDQTNSGAGREGTLAQISRVFEQYLKDVGSPAKVERLAFSPVAQPEGTGHVDTATYPEVGLFLYAPYEHIVSQFDRHVLGANSIDQLVERPEYGKFKGAMLERMKRDKKLDTFLASFAKN